MQLLLFYRLIQRRVITLVTAPWVTLDETVSPLLHYVQATLVSTVALVSWVQVAHCAFALLVTLTRVTTAENTPDAIRCLVKTVREQTDLTAPAESQKSLRPIFLLFFLSFSNALMETGLMPFFLFHFVSFALLADGKCTQTESGYTCSCQSGFSGNNCEINQDDCAGVICQNGGTCIDGKKDFYCRCPPGYSGKWCQNRVDLCRGSPCANGGTCIDSDGIDFTCSCAPGFTGKHCSVNIDECQSNPCLNGGACQDRVNEFVCHCINGFKGPICQYPADSMPWAPSMSTLSSSPSVNDSAITGSMGSVTSSSSSSTNDPDDSQFTGNSGLALGTQEFMPDVAGASVMISIIFATTLALLSRNS